MSPIPLPLPPLITPSGNFGTFQIGGRSNVSLPVDDYDIVNKLYVDTLGTGYVRAPTSSLANTIPLFADTTGKLLSDSTLLVTSGNQISNVSSISLIGTGSVTISANPSSSTYQLVLPQSQGAPNSFLRNDGLGGLDWGTPLGGGNVTGPVTSTTNAIALYFNTTGTIIKNSTVLVSATGGISGVISLQMNGSTSGNITITPAATTTSYTLTMPNAQSSANVSSSLVNDGTGVLSWSPTGVLPPSIGIKPVTYALQSSDQSKIFIYTTGGGTINFTNGSLFSGFYCYVKNGSSTDITLQFNSVDVLGVTSTLHRATGSGNSSICVLYYDGTNLILY